MQKHVPLSSIKHLFLIKNGQNWRCNLWKCAVSGCVWKHPAWILRMFIHFYEGLDDFWTVFGHFWPLLTLFESFLTLSGAYRAIFRPFWNHHRVILEWFWTIFGSIRGHMGSLWDHFGIVLESFLGRFDVVRTAFWGLFRPFFGPFSLRFFLPFLGHFYGHIVVFLVMFWEVDCTFK